jgi:hypothetical protein
MPDGRAGPGRRTGRGPGRPQATGRGLTVYAFQLSAEPARLWGRFLAVGGVRAPLTPSAAGVTAWIIIRLSRLQSWVLRLAAARSRWEVKFFYFFQLEAARPTRGIVAASSSESPPFALFQVVRWSRRGASRLHHRRAPDGSSAIVMQI